MKLDSDRRNGTDVFTNKFVGKVQSIFASLPKPKEWRTFFVNDLPLLISIDADVQDVAAEHELKHGSDFINKLVNKSQKACVGRT